MAERSVQIQFVTEVAGEDQSIEIELDDDKHEALYGEAKSQFYYGEEVYFRIFTTPNDLQYTMQASDGTLFSRAGGIFEVSKEVVSFPNRAEANVDYPIKEITTVDWLGNNLGNVTPAGASVKVTAAGVAICHLTYNVEYRAGSLVLATQSGYDTYPVLVLVKSVES
jgi:hypothetical protein